MFDGVIVDMRAGPGGHRFADASLVEASPDDTVPDDLTDKLKRAWDYLSGNY